MKDEQAIQQFLGDRPRAEEWARMRRTLQDRMQRLQAEREAAAPDARAALDARLKTLAEQIAALEQEELVTQFVEDSVRVTLAMGSVVDEDAEA
jgi:hypothetical protein